MSNDESTARDAEMAAMRAELAHLREEVSLPKMEPRPAYELARIGGNWLGDARSWIQRKKRNGERVTWVSNDVLEPPMTMREVEEVAAEAAAGALRDRHEAVRRLDEMRKRRLRIEIELTQRAERAEAEIASLRARLTASEGAAGAYREALEDLEQLWQDRALGDQDVIASMMEIVRAALASPAGTSHAAEIERLRGTVEAQNEGLSEIARVIGSAYIPPGTGARELAACVKKKLDDAIALKEVARERCKTAEADVDAARERIAELTKERDAAKKSVYEALTDGISARIRNKEPAPPFPAGTPECNAWLIGYGGQECADERDAARQEVEALRRDVERWHTQAILCAQKSSAEMVERLRVESELTAARIALEEARRSLAVIRDDLKTGAEAVDKGTIQYGKTAAAGMRKILETRFAALAPVPSTGDGDGSADANGGDRG